MVYCGKPSKGCKHCRVRRIKCDLIEPACSQCLRAGKSCLGYRDQLSLRFRDENEKVVRKTKVILSASPECRKPSVGQTNSAKNIDSSASTAPILSVTGPNTHSQALVVPTPTPLTRPLTSQCLDEGVVFFFDHYMTINTNYPSWEFNLPRSHAWQLVFGIHAFNNAVSSVGYAGLANVTKNPAYTVIARRKYAASLQNITLALKDTSKVDLDATFKSVILLAAFELVSGGSGEWGVHIDGGAAILKLIAAKQPRHVPSMRMQLQFVFSGYIKCLTAGESSPPDLEWVQQIRNSLTTEDAHAADLASIVSRFTNFHATVQCELLNDPHAILREALLLDEALEKWERQLPQSWNYRLERHTEATAVMYQGVAHRYRDFWTARIYCHYRWSRILVNELLLTHLGSFSIEETAQRTKSRDIISKQAADICSSISIQFDKPTLMQEAKQNGVPALSGCFLPLFPLAVAGSATGVPQELHDWVIAMLETIGHEKGINQALAMIPPTKFLREKWKMFGVSTSDCSLLKGIKM